jgi:alpha,alpha-trehalase
MQIFEMGELFEKVQMQAILADGKTFPDAHPLYDISLILEVYTTEKHLPLFSLTDFLKRHFALPEDKQAISVVEKKSKAADSIEALWPVLTRQDDSSALHSSLIPLPYPYVVPGGRFREIYYWDSYFTMLGLLCSGREQAAKDMLNNFTYLINTVGYIPNGNRQYYLGRSQPPFYSLMVQEVCKQCGSSILAYLPAIHQEYKWWMRYEDELSVDNNAISHVVLMPDGEILNRYFDEYNTPRPESFKEDVELVLNMTNQAVAYRNIRAAAASGWDFSTRWFKNSNEFSSIHTTDIIPVDLNCLLYLTEKLLSVLYEEAGNSVQTLHFKMKALRRKKAIEKYCWNNEQQFYFDYDFKAGRQKDVMTLAACFPLFSEIASTSQAEAVAQYLHRFFLKEGGLLTSLYYSKQQWDAPNGWAPLQWIAIKGLKHYQMYNLAADIGRRWLRLNDKVFQRTGKMMEKYNVEDLTLEAGGGEYPAQDGFGWTNGVYLKLKSFLTKPD